MFIIFFFFAINSNPNIIEHVYYIFGEVKNLLERNLHLVYSSVYMKIKACNIFTAFKFLAVYATF